MLTTSTTGPLNMYIPRDSPSSAEIHPHSEVIMSRHAVSVDVVDDYPESNSRRTTTAPPLSQEQLVTSQFQDFWMPVLSCALLVTGNTFGAGSLVLPQLAEEPGLAPAGAIFAMAYVLNLISGLTFANVAIEQYQSGSNNNEQQEVPSSFKEFVQTNLNSPELAILISLVSFGVNSLVFAFDMSRIGVLFSGLLDPALSIPLYATALLTLLATLSPSQMSQAASVCVMTLFATFGSLLLPGLASLTHPVADWFTPGLAAGDPLRFWHSVGEITPVIVMSMVFQNIVPSVVKLLDYNRAKAFTAIGLGSFLPLLMYVSWCWATLGEGGIDLAATIRGIDTNPLLTVFSLSTLMGSSIGCALSCAAELDIFVKQSQENNNNNIEPAVEQSEKPTDEKFQLISVLATLGLPLAMNLAVSQGGDLIGALHVAGGLGTPILYGTIPILMTLKQQERLEQKTKGTNAGSNQDAWGKMGLGALGVASTGLLGVNVVDFANNIVGPAMLPTAIAATTVAAI